MITHPTVYVLLIIFLGESPFDRIPEGNGFLITAIGLIAVFLGLFILWGVTASLKYLIEKIPQQASLTNIQSQNIFEKDLTDDSMDEEIVAAITIALHFELEEVPSKLTLRHHEQEMSPWVVASRPATMRRQ